MMTEPQPSDPQIIREAVQDISTPAAALGSEDIDNAMQPLQRLAT